MDYSDICIHLLGVSDYTLVVVDNNFEILIHMNTLIPIVKFYVTSF